MIDDPRSELREQGTALARFTRDLTADARAGRLEPVRSRAEEISRVVDILLRQGKNNPTLVGEAGVGKTAVVEGLAQRVAEGRVPLTLRGIRILALDHVALLAGTTYRGQYEERIRRLIDETTAAGDVVLFVDELHNLIGQGTAMGTAMDAANMLKPALVRGDFRVIGATTNDEYERWVLGDPALERRFQKIDVRELGPDETLDILRARQARLERHHNVVIAEGALVASVRLTDLYVPDRHRPDKAIDALDEACAHAQALALYTPRTEALIRARMQRLRRGEARAADGADAGPERVVDHGAVRTDAEPDPLARFTRGGFDALERFGAELEAMFVSGPERDLGAAAPSGAAVEEPSPPDVPHRGAAADPTLPASLAELETELARRLMEEGIVVRAHDVARVVSLMSGTTITWTD
ncbi:MAG TPA: AAA family ATPase [Gemmatimonadaceae bacterium]|nr:AAA family ATPase [Gemmatimonadaceae bacterium]